MTIRVVTDSTCDLPTEFAGLYGITILPLYINFGLESYLDGVDLSREAFYARLPASDPLPTTAVPGPQRFLGAYRRLAEEGATEILSVDITPVLGTHLGPRAVGFACVRKGKAS
jgi:DegV family protein with EDD domain